MLGIADHFLPEVVRLLVDAGADTASTVRIKGVQDEDVAFDSSLAFTNRCLGEKKLLDGEDATEEQHTWQAIRRLLIMRVEAVHAVSWLWASRAACVARAV